MNRRVEEKIVLKKKVKVLLSKVLLSIILLLIGMISIKEKPSLKVKLQETIYEKSIKPQKMKSIYEKYFGNILSISKTKKKTTTPVFSEKLTYESIKPYENGVKLKVKENYQVPVLETGVVIFLGEKEKYGQTVIVEQVDGIDTFYSNIKTDNIKLYDYVEKGEVIGIANDNYFYLVFKKNGEYLDYKEYI